MPARLAILAATVALALDTASAAPPASPVGHWRTADGNGVIDIAPCGAALCGRIAGFELDNPDDPLPQDWKGRPQCGLAIIRDAVPHGDVWQGEILDPRDGTSYNATLRLDGDGRLKLRGYILTPLLGATQVWTRYDGPLPSDCRMIAQQPPGGMPPARATLHRGGQHAVS